MECVDEEAISKETHCYESQCS